ncbi:MAG: aldo/keto reductase [Candidatus Wallbacteria bacterium HGW-Wallbacteria-1]|uniref:Aldo/keto reductase n=1 Tax=Candidatus Wallbacteria bacterium HGW-Wallbacteria-1 TaxID=2013854 RepID=A0A2N1PI75_9BACT|nr:MAG: aldo/keto reductase [Candidatus Wallbacteria bacterium HGW-Wallbacteria-1]
MQYRTFGKTGEKVSVLGFGCMRLPILGNDHTKINEPEAVKMIRYAIDHGVNFIDTAYPYHSNDFSKGGMSEPLVARALADGYRKKVKIQTKLPSWLINSPQDFDKYLNEQLQRLNTAQIDFYILHALNRKTWDNLKKHGAIEFLERAKKDGRIKHAGFSFHDTKEVFMEIVDANDWDFCLIQYNYLDEDFQQGKEGLDRAIQKGMGIAIMEPLKGGNLVKELPAEAEEIFKSSKVKHTKAEWAFKWLWNNPGIHVVLSGMSLMDHVKENVQTACKSAPNSLSADELARFAGVQEAFRKTRKVNCTKCRYCMPCPFGVDIPKNFQHYNDSFLFGSKGAKDKLKRAYSFLISENESAKKCTGCGLCETHCPQKIKIREKMAEIVTLVG